MATATNRYMDYDYDHTIQAYRTATTSATSYYAGTYRGYPISYVEGGFGYIPEATPAKKKTFEDKLQNEIDDWLSIFKEK